MLSCFPVIADPSTVEQRRFPPCCSRAEVAPINLTLISPICAWKGKVYIVTPPNLKLDYIVKRKEKEIVRKTNTYKLLICISANRILFVLDMFHSFRGLR